MATFAAPSRKRATRLSVLDGGVTADGLKEDQILGRVVLTSMPDEGRNGALLMREWINAGLDEEVLPEARQDVDRFRSACASVQERTVDPKTGQKIEILANQVTRDGTAYQITVRRWNLKAREIDHEKSMRVEFDRKTNAISAAQLDNYDPRVMGRLLTAVQDHFDANAATVPGQKVRNAVRQVLLDLGATNMMRRRGGRGGGGVYFVPRESAGGLQTLPTLEGLKQVLANLYGGEANFDLMKYANEEGEREIVRRHFATNADEKARELAEKAWERVRKGKGDRGVRSDLIGNLQNERRSLLGQVKHFEELVSFERADVQESIAELDEALEKLDDLANEPA